MNENEATWLTDLSVHEAHGIMFSRKGQRVSVGYHAIDFELADGAELADIDVCPDKFLDIRERPARTLLTGVTGVLVGAIRPVWHEGKVLTYTRKIRFAGPFLMDGFCVTAFGDTEADLALCGDATEEYAQAGKN